MNRAWAMKAETRIAALERQVRELALQLAELQAKRARPPKEKAE
jgi:hypothetical protein